LVHFLRPFDYARLPRGPLSRKPGQALSFPSLQPRFSISSRYRTQVAISGRLTTTISTTTPTSEKTFRAGQARLPATMAGSDGSYDLLRRATQAVMSRLVLNLSPLPPTPKQRPGLSIERNVAALSSHCHHFAPPFPFPLPRTQSHCIMRQRNICRLCYSSGPQSWSQSWVLRGFVLTPEGGEGQAELEAHPAAHQTLSTG
jgi:hypothetical protein